MLLAAIGLFIVEVIIATKLNDYHFIRAYFGDFLVVIAVSSITGLGDAGP